MQPLYKDTRAGEARDDEITNTLSPVLFVHGPSPKARAIAGLRQLPSLSFGFPSVSLRAQATGLRPGEAQLPSRGRFVAECGFGMPSPYKGSGCDQGKPRAFPPPLIPPLKRGEVFSSFSHPLCGRI